MSGLAGLLAGHRAPGVYRWHAAFGAAEVRRAVEHAGWRFARLDGVGIEDRPALLDALGVALDAAEHYGSNLDALWDVLRDADGPLLLLWDAWGPLARADRDAFDVVTELFADRADEGGLAVLLRGEGPETGLPSLD
jgi:RNAse (barnase) inhibitor barstar